MGGLQASPGRDDHIPVDAPDRPPVSWGGGRREAQPQREQINEQGIPTTILGGENCLSLPQMAELPTEMTKGHLESMSSWPRDSVGHVSE